MTFLLMMVVLPLVEIYLFIIVGGAIGALTTVLWCVFSAFAGFYALRHHGRQSVARYRASIAEGSSPTYDILSSMLIHVGGVLLLVPGFMTDAAGLLCLLRLSREFIIRLAVKRASVSVNGFGFGVSRKKSKRKEFLEGEYRRRD